MITRFAPSPTGPLHLGHAYSAMLAHDMATAAGGMFLLRIEDTDITRARPEWEAQIYDDLRWLGLSWPEPVLRQSDHLGRYAAVLADLGRRGLTYPCSCSRADIRAALSAPQEGALPEGPDGLIYPGTCRGRPMSSMQESDAIRLDMASAIRTLKKLPGFEETGEHPGWVQTDAGDLINGVGDVVLGRKDIRTVAYHLANVTDDAGQQITHVVRGMDLFEATRIHVVLQALLGLPSPVYHHHRLIRDTAGKRLAKRDDARALSRYRAEGATPDDIRRMVGL